MPTASLAAGKRVVLFSLPWGAMLEPCLGLGILKTVLRQHGIECDVVEATPHLLRWIKYDTYDQFSAIWALNDFLFTHEFEPEISPDQMEVVKRICSDDQELVRGYFFKVKPLDTDIEKVIRLRQEVIPAFLDDIMSRVDFDCYCMAGFTCLFDQTWASLSLARKIKRAYPDLPLAFGGYSVDKPTGPSLQKVMREMDIVAYGDGEPTIVPLVEACCGFRPFDEVPNISYRQNGEVVYSKAAPQKIDLIDSPVPNYDDWFFTREEMKSVHQVEYPVGEMPLESSRGCWWGQKHHCTFCGIDETALIYRKKPAATIIEQLDLLHERYGAHVFRFSDYIMPISHFSDFLRLMAERGAPYLLHYETKANLTLEQLQLASKAGVYYLQPGVESFSTAILKKMDKGVRGIQNIFLIYQMMRHNIFCYYNLIFGFPGDQAAEYWPMIKMIPSLYHLIAPGSITYPMVVRHAPLHTNPPRFGAASFELSAHWRYDVMFSRQFLAKHPIDFVNCGYYFDPPHPYREFDDVTLAAFDALQHQVILWSEHFEKRRARLSFEEHDDGITFREARTGNEESAIEFDERHRSVYQLLTERIWNEDRLLMELHGQGISEADTREIVGTLLEARLIVREDKSYTAIALPKSFYDDDSSSRSWWMQPPELVRNTKNNSPPTVDFAHMPAFELGPKCLTLV